ncbi:hypothetical protein SH449x_000066 [Pirellulaceae bacterium SH449]
MVSISCLIVCPEAEQNGQAAVLAKAADAAFERASKASDQEVAGPINVNQKPIVNQHGTLTQASVTAVRNILLINISLKTQPSGRIVKDRSF